MLFLFFSFLYTKTAINCLLNVINLSNLKLKIEFEKYNKIKCCTFYFLATMANRLIVNTKTKEDLFPKKKMMRNSNHILIMMLRKIVF
jgi:hypothetical protein